VARTLSAREPAAEAGVSLEIIDWLAGIGILKPRQPNPFVPGDVFRAKMAASSQPAAPS
jgi:hypothetical protein